MKNETANPQNSTFASPDTRAKASACKRAVFCQHTGGKLLHLWLSVWIDLNYNGRK
jgi:hypothetical protein